MKNIKYSYVILMLLVLATVSLGGVLSMTYDDHLRMLHRGAAMLSGLAAMTILVLAFVEKARRRDKVLAGGVLLLVLSAASAGKMLGTGGDYDTWMLIMRLSGLVALALSLVLVARSWATPAKRKKG